MQGLKPGASAKSLTIMYAMVSLVFVFCACVFSDYQLLFYFVASVFVMGVMVEKSAVLFVVFYVIVIGGALLLVPDRTYLFPYLFFFGYYAIIKYILDIAVKKTVPCLLVKIGLFTLGGFLVYVAQPVLFFSYIPEGWPVWAFVIMMEGIFIGYDFIFRALTVWYLMRVRNHLKRSTY